MILIGRRVQSQSLPCYPCRLRMRCGLEADQLLFVQAADALRVLGIGRNAYISIMNACKAKKGLLWRMSSAKAVARDLLPSEPRPTSMQPWWLVSVVNLGEMGCDVFLYCSWLW